MNIVNIYNAKTNLSGLIERAIAGEDIIISKFNKPLVRLTPIENGVRPRQLGTFKGKIKISKDFDEADSTISDLFYAEE
ncbi:type II toxin-antitoxin system Phd/YefM family antitoxin [Candidatus Woesebacteria bacterium]|nr:type II toxin-antitoxin system Phd/YefM family antitoxin [Candidatus Woesebacteria bacterium]